jgi:hypothetical protein
MQIEDHQELISTYLEDNESVLWSYSWQYKDFLKKLRADSDIRIKIVAILIFVINALRRISNNKTDIFLFTDLHLLRIRLLKNGKTSAKALSYDEMLGYDTLELKEITFFLFIKAKKKMYLAVLNQDVKTVRKIIDSQGQIQN